MDQGFLCWLKGQERHQPVWEDKILTAKEAVGAILDTNIHFPWITPQIRPGLGLGKLCFVWPTKSSLWNLHSRWHLPSPQPPLCQRGHFGVAAQCPQQHRQKDKAKPGAWTPKGKPEHFPTRKPTQVLSSLSIGGKSDRQLLIKKAFARVDHPAILPWRVSWSPAEDSSKENAKAVGV